MSVFIGMIKNRNLWKYVSDMLYYPLNPLHVVFALAIICTNPPAIANGHADATFAAINNIIDYSCAECYKMEEFVEVKCLPNRTWSRPLPSCKRKACACNIMQLTVQVLCI